MAETKSKEYRIWSEAKYRCHNPSNKRFVYYGGRGIQMCAAWRNSFQQFMSDIGPRPNGYSLERINNDGNYEPGNVVWADRKTQCRNRRSNVLVTHNGKTMTLIEWSEDTGLSYSLLHQRYVANGIEELFRPIQTKYSSKLRHSR